MFTGPWSVPDCISLAAECERLKKEYAKAVDRLFADGYRISDAEYAGLRNAIEEARVQADLARRRLETHNRALHSKAI